MKDRLPKIHAAYDALIDRSTKKSDDHLMALDRAIFMKNREKLNQIKIKSAFDKFCTNENRSSEQQMAFDRAVFICVGGSRSYGMQNDKEIEGRESDVDLRGTFIGQPRHYLGLRTIEQVEVVRSDGSGEKDTLYEFRKFIKLALENNPNIIEQLFLRPEHMLLVKPEFEPFLEHRELFLSKKCKHSYSGYAFAQLKRISGHYEWLQNPPVEPKREDYEVTRYKHSVEGKVIPEWDYLAKKTKVENIFKSAGISAEGRTSFFEDMSLWLPFKDVDKDAWDKANKKWEQYQTWRKERSKVRAGLEAAHGYDTKHASHLMRLLLQGRQILKEKTLSAYLEGEDYDFVQSVKAGKFDYPELIAEAEKLNAQLEDLYETSDLRHAPAFDEVEALCIDVLKKRLGSE